VSVPPDHLLKFFSLVSVHDVDEEDNSEEKGEEIDFPVLVLGRVIVDYLRGFIAYITMDVEKKNHLKRFIA